MPCLFVLGMLAALYEMISLFFLCVVFVLLGISMGGKDCRLKSTCCIQILKTFSFRCDI